MISTQIERPKRQEYKGLAVQYLVNNGSRKTAIMVPGVGIPGKEFGWMYSLRSLGFNAVYAPYRGTWFSKGEFLPSNTGKLSVTDDVTDLIEFSLEKLDSTEVIVVGDCFGSSPALVASARYKEVSKVFLYGGMIFSDDPSLNKKYANAVNGNGVKRDKVAALGQTLANAATDGGEYFNGYAGFDINVWQQMILGQTELVPHKVIPELAKKRIMIMHSANDSLVDYERSVDFFGALRSYCKRNKLRTKAKLKIINGGKGHRSGFGTRQELQAMWFLKKGCLTFPKAVYTAHKGIKAHKKGVQRPDQSWFGAPFYDLIVDQIREFQDKGLLHDQPLEKILNRIF
jgi:pimeloyl-ACP methyl ester carboxylesterase